MKNYFFKLAVSILATSLVTVTAQAAKLYRTGNALDAKGVVTEPMTCLAGGGDDDLWASGWKRMLINSRGGDIVIIRSDGRRGGYESWIYDDTSGNGFPKVNSVSTISLSKKDDGNRNDVVSLVNNAELVFFAGGDQALYLSLISGTRLEQALNEAMHIRRIPFGGTSAGMALLGGIDYTARYSSPSKNNAMVTAQDVLMDPTGTFVDLNRNTLVPNYMSNVITDTHFSERSRQGRLAGFMARAVYNKYGDMNYSNIKGMGADEGTAACIDGAGYVSVFGAATVYFVQGMTPIERIRPGASLDWNGSGQAMKVNVIQGVAGDSTRPVFDMNTWTAFDGVQMNWFVDGSNPSNPIFIAK